MAQGLQKPTANQAENERKPEEQDDGQVLDYDGLYFIHSDPAFNLHDAGIQVLHLFQPRKEVHASNTHKT